MRGPKPTAPNLAQPPEDVRSSPAHPSTAREALKLSTPESEGLPPTDQAALANPASVAGLLQRQEASRGLDLKGFPLVIIPTPDPPTFRPEWKEKKSTFTKIIQNVRSGVVVARYPRIPKIEIPHHPMVNDVNQDLCGGWAAWPGKIGRSGNWMAGDWRDSVHTESAIIAHRLLHGLKPAGEADGPEWACEQWQRAFQGSGSFACRAIPPHPERQEHTGTGDAPSLSWTLQIARKGTPDEVFGKDYLNAVEAYYQACFRKFPYACEQLQEALGLWRREHQVFDIFDKDWDALEHWEVPILGLSLGYPIENTVSRLI